MKNYLKKMFIAVLCLCFILFTACSATPPNTGYGDLLAIMPAATDTPVQDAIGGRWFWTAYEGRVWTCGYQPGEFTSVEEMETWVACVNADGTDAAAMQLLSPFDPALMEQRDQLTAENPDTKYMLYRSLRSMLFNSTGTPYFILQEQMLRLAPQDRFYHPVVDRYILCTVAQDGSLQREMTLTLPDTLTDGDVTFTPKDFLLTDDDTLWVHMSGTAADSSGIQKNVDSFLLRYALTDGSCTARADLQEGYYTYGETGALRQMPDGSLLLFAKPNEMSDYSFFTVTDITGDAPVVSQPIPIAENALPIFGFVPPLNGKPTQDVLVYTGAGVMQCNVQQGTAELLLDWAEHGFGMDNFHANVFCNLEGEVLQILRIGSDGTLHMLP